MYTKELEKVGDNGCSYWLIIDPNGTSICVVEGTDGADILLTHLNSLLTHLNRG